jgi:hypothetical protein
MNLMQDISQKEYNMSLVKMTDKITHIKKIILLSGKIANALALKTDITYLHS